MTPWLRSHLALAVDTLRRSPVLLGIAKRFAPPDPWANNKDAARFRALELEYPFVHRRIGDDARWHDLALISSDQESRAYFKDACEALGVVPWLLDGLDSDLFERLEQAKPWGVLYRPPHQVALWRSIYEEKLDAVAHQLGIPVYPGRPELAIYENKRRLAFLLEAAGIPHPLTQVIFRREEALEAVANAAYPLVFKTVTSSAAAGVEIARDRRAAERLVKLFFDRFYLGRDLRDSRDGDWGYVILQRYLPHVREFRVIQIGDSWFGHEKSKRDAQEFMSGSGVNLWTVPPSELLDFCHGISQRCGFRTMCFDVFLDAREGYLVNELQTWFGSYNPAQLYRDGVPGRFRKLAGQWRFESGTFNVHGSMLLRILDFHEQLSTSAGGLSVAPHEPTA